MTAQVAPRILVTGGSGFIGTNVIDYFRAHDTQIVNLDSAEPRDPQHTQFWVRGDICQSEDVDALVAEFDPVWVVHLAARTDLAGKVPSDYDANVRGVTNVVRALASARSLERTIYASSRMVCEIAYQPATDDDYCPPNAYGASKVEGERIVREHARRPWTLVRPTSIWGPWFGVPYRDFFDAIQRRRFVQATSNPIRKSFGYVGNTVYQLHRLLAAPVSEVDGRTLYLGDYPPLEVSSWAEEIRRALDAPRIRHAPLAVVRIVATIGDLLQRIGWEDVPLTNFRLRNLLTEMVYDLAPLEAIVGPLPYTTHEGVVRTAAWMSRGDAPTAQNA